MRRNDGSEGEKYEGEGGRGMCTGWPRAFLERGRGLEGKDVDNLANLSERKRVRCGVREWVNDEWAKEGWQKGRDEA